MRKADLYKREELLVKCFECFCKNGIEGTSAQKHAEACGMSSGNIFHYFKTKDEIIIDATAYCMAKAEDDFMAKAPKDYKDIQRFLHEVPYWTAEKHGEKYRFMFQIYTSPKYRVRACVYYALFEDEEYLLPQIELIDAVLPLIAEKYGGKARRGSTD